MKILMLLVFFWPAFALGQYGYPIKSPFFAAVAGTPEALSVLPGSEVISEVTLRVHTSSDKKKQVPDLFSEVDSPAFKLAWQNKAAPMVFIIAGTGGRYDTQKVEYLKAIYYGNGYHVVQLSSPTSFDFIVNSSGSHRPGLARQDAEDIYVLMQSVLKRIELFKKLSITDIHLTGYSLGALNAAWVGYLDERQKKIGFDRILLMNPPVYLQVSLNNLDKMILAKVPGVTDSNTLFEHFFTKLANYFRLHKSIDVDKGMMFDLQKSNKALTDEELALLIGLSFRFSVASMTFTSDIMNRSGLVVPKGLTITDTDSRTPYFRQVMHCSFDCYLHRMLLPVLNVTPPFKTTAQHLNDNSLPPLKRWLEKSSRVGVMHNADDFILDQKGLTFLYDVFGKRAMIYPRGGHMGNLQYKDNVRDMLWFMKNGAFPDA
ncbi:hypothetical protein ACH42_05160 [Endozoicomonas sp. (ex Bugula neritina AB1)]|nr:hypothetical protein ACH42_05160 [Endozoicomonas sp. (ex Bugula neritina AB1)]